MLIGAIITYNDFPLLKECVDSILDKVDKLIIVDGKYKDFPGDTSFSTGESLEYLLELSNDKRIEIFFEDSLCEVDKRNIYLTQCQEGDIVLNLDSDEKLIGETPALKSDFGIVKMHVDRLTTDRATRFFKYREGMRYKHVHYTLYWQDNMINNLRTVINNNFSFEKIKSFYLLHQWKKRSHYRQHQKQVYYKKLIKNERGYPR